MGLHDLLLKVIDFSALEPAEEESPPDEVACCSETAGEERA